jgi:hypothetical protein
VASHALGHAEVEKDRAEVAWLSLRVTQKDSEIKRLTLIECSWKDHRKRAISELYEHRYYGHRPYSDGRRHVAQLVLCVQYAVIATRVGLPKDTAVKRNLEMAEGLAFKCQPGDGPTPESIGQQVEVLCQMGITSGGGRGDEGRPRISA